MTYISNDSWEVTSNSYLLTSLFQSFPIRNPNTKVEKATAETDISVLATICQVMAPLWNRSIFILETWRRTTWHTILTALVSITWIWLTSVDSIWFPPKLVLLSLVPKEVSASFHRITLELSETEVTHLFSSLALKTSVLSQVSELLHATEKCLTFS